MQDNEIYTTGIEPGQQPENGGKKTQDKSGKFHQTVLNFASVNLPANKKVFYICTYGGSAAYKSIEEVTASKHAVNIGYFGCKGYDTFGPFKLLGGIAKGHPDEKDIANAVAFYKKLEEKI